MPKSGLTAIAVVMDQSGSMQSIKGDAIGGFNSFLEAQKKCPGEALFSLVLFDSANYNEVYMNVPIKDVKPLDDSSYKPGACTPLLDAIGNTMNKVGQSLVAMKEEDRPEKVVFVILTDGLENASKTFGGDKIKEMIDLQTQSYKWQFVFLAANMDACLVGGSMGIGIMGTQSWAGGAQLRAAYIGTASAVSTYRCCADPNAKVVVNVNPK